MSTTSFINTLAPLAIAECNKRTKKVHPSVCIAQAALETGWGTSNLMVKANAYFGIKAGSSWKGKVYNSKTWEVVNNTSITTNAYFRAYDTLAESVADYYDLITGASRYAAGVNASSAQACIKGIHEGGYATDPAYQTKIMSIINSSNLTQYDGVMSGSVTDNTSTITTPASSGGTYTVKSGDNLTKIAKANNVTVSAIVSANKSKYNKITADYIQVGWVLTIPGSTSANKTISAGQSVTLSKVKLYASATATTNASTVSGGYYVADATVKNNRVRITNKISNVGNMSQVTGWINVSDI